jgi:hypothetical protein
VKIDRLAAKGFLGLKAAVELVPKAPVVLVLGDNESGKSSLRDLLEFAITGLLPSRGVTTKKGSKAVASDTPCSVEACVGGISWERNPAGASLQEGQLAARFPTEMVRSLLNAWRFVDLPLKERRDLVRAITAKPEKIAGAVLKLVTDAGLAPTVAEYMAATARGDLDAAEKHSVAMRVDHKRKLEALPEPPKPRVEVGGQTYELPSIVVGDIDGLLAEIKVERDKLIGQYQIAKLADSPEVIAARMEATGKELFASSASKPGDVKRYEAEALAADAKVNAARDVYAQAQATKKAAEKRLEAIKTLQDSCPTCGQSVTPKVLKGLCDREQKDVDRAISILTTAEVDGKKAKADAEQARVRAQNAREAEGRRAELTQQMADDKEALEAGKAYPMLEKSITELDDRDHIGRQLRDAKRAYDQAMAVDAKRAEYKTLIDKWDAVAQGLGPKGEVRKLAAEGFDLAAVKAHAKVLLGRDVEIDAEWNITLGGLAEGMLSESAKYRLGACFAAALAVASGLGFLVLDRADVLSDTNRGALLGWLEGLAGKLDTVIVLATSSAKVEPADWLDVRYLEKGVLSDGAA